jgi:hypothetical protein
VGELDATTYEPDAHSTRRRSLWEHRSGGRGDLLPPASARLLLVADPGDGEPRISMWRSEMHLTGRGLVGWGPLVGRWRPGPDAPRRANHEAAHAVMGGCSVIPVRHLTIESTAEAGGRCQLRGQVSPTDRLLVALAGPASDGNTRDGWSDLVDAIGCVFDRDRADSVDLLRNGDAAARNILSLPRIARAVDALAGELAACVILPPEDVPRIIAASLAEPFRPHHRRRYR